MGTFNVSITPHRTLNYSRGVISESDLFTCSEEEILENLKDQGVISVRRITIRRDGKTISTKHLIITFNTPSLPSSVTAAYLKCRVRPFVPNPLRCYKCQKFGHGKEFCRGNITCARCSNPGHESDSCNETPHCVNCKGEHPSFSRSCPKWIKEKEIQAIKASRNISFAEARSIVDGRTPTIGLSYATVAAPIPKKSIATQTEPVVSKPIRSANKPQQKKDEPNITNRNIQPSSPPPVRHKNSKQTSTDPFTTNARQSATPSTSAAFPISVTTPSDHNKKVNQSSPHSTRKNIADSKQSASYHITADTPIPPNQNRKKVAIPRKCVGLSRKAKDPHYILKNNQYVRRFAENADEVELYASEDSDNGVVFEET